MVADNVPSLPMQGHTKPVTAVSFSPDGKLIATFSLEENTVRIWQPSGSFLGTLVGALTTGGAATGAAGVAALASVGGVGHMKSFRTFNLGPADGRCLRHDQLFSGRMNINGFHMISKCSQGPFGRVRRCSV